MIFVYVVVVKNIKLVTDVNFKIINNMKKYTIQHRIRTITSNSVISGIIPATFSVDNIELKQDFSWQNGPTGDYWVASSDIESDTWQEAMLIFRKKLRLIVSRISLIGQGYIDFLREPFLITSQSNFPDIGIFRYVVDQDHVGLSFLDEHKLALEKLLVDKHISDEFYLYWNDATNTTGYSAKLLLMFSAIESLSRTRDKNLFPKPSDLSKKILGDSLSKEIFNPEDGIRNRLAHGEYWEATNSTIDYVQIIHQKVISFINTEILKETLIDEDVVDPQRNFFENKGSWGPGFIKKAQSEMSGPLSLGYVMKSFDKENESEFYTTIGHGEEFDKLNKEF